MGLKVIFLIVVIVLFVLASFNVSVERLNLTAGGLAFFAASFLV